MDNAGVIVSVRSRFTDWCVGEVESVTVTVMVPELAAPGVPEITPAADMFTPAGRPLAVQVYGAVPPAAVTEAEYRLPAGPVGSVAVVIDNAGEMDSVNPCVTDWCVGLVASVTVTFTVPPLAALGVPEMVPLTALIASPAGSPVAD